MTTSNLFLKAAVCTDIHVGLKNNSTLHNEDCLAFIRWFIETAKQNDCDTALILGDWHNNRASISVLSLNYSMKCLELLNEAFSKVWFITGNHDLYYRENRSVHSVAWADYLPNIRIVDEIIDTGNVTLCPWLVGDEIKECKHFNTKYVFGHFELPDFYMNSLVKMPKHGEFDVDYFSKVEKVYSGHFHKRQTRGNVHYIGNAFPHNYSDVGDTQRGMMVLPWGKEPVFHAWPDQPSFHVMNVSDIIERHETLLGPKMNIRAYIDTPLSYEEVSSVKEALVPQYGLRELAFIPLRTESPTGEISQTLQFESVDSIVQHAIAKIESDVYDRELLRQIYEQL